jgi:hypothetical protein
MVDEVEAKRAIAENFGGNQLHLTRVRTVSVPKSYSAYMLFYVRENKTGDVFNEGQLTAVGDHVRAYAEERIEAAAAELAAVGSALKIFTEDGLQKNCAVLGLTAKGSSLALEIDGSATLEELYAQTAELLDCDIKTIRLWRVGLTAPLEGPILCSKRLTVDSMIVKRIFVQRKLANKELPLKLGQIVVFVKCYTQNSSCPLVFLKSCVVSSADSINKVFVSLVGTSDCAAFREDPTSTVMPIRRLLPTLSWLSQNCLNGTVLVLQPTKVWRQIGFKK